MREGGKDGKERRGREKEGKTTSAEIKCGREGEREREKGRRRKEKELGRR